MLACEQIQLEMPWGFVKGQIFGDRKKTKPIFCLHGYMDSSNTFKPLASFLCETNQYHLVCIDLPGQGLSSPIDNPMLYNLKTFIFCIRKVILDLNLKVEIFMGHSLGCTLGLMYFACFPEEVKEIILLDFVFDTTNSNKDLAMTWRESISKLIKGEEATGNQYSKELTYDLALEKLLKANRHVDEKAGRILLERAIVKVDDHLEFSRDRNLGVYLPIKFHLSEFQCIRPSIAKNIKSSILHIYAYPYPYGEKAFKLVDEILGELKSNGNQVQTVKVDGSHHFHMIKERDTATLILNFLGNNPKVIPDSRI